MVERKEVKRGRRVIKKLEKKQGSKLLPILGGVFALLAISGIIFFVLHQQKKDFIDGTYLQLSTAERTVKKENDFSKALERIEVVKNRIKEKENYFSAEQIQDIENRSRSINVWYEAEQKLSETEKLFAELETWELFQFIEQRQKFILSFTYKDEEILPSQVEKRKQFLLNIKNKEDAILRDLISKKNTEIEEKFALKNFADVDKEWATFIDSLNHGADDSRKESVKFLSEKDDKNIQYHVKKYREGLALYEEANKTDDDLEYERVVEDLSKIQSGINDRHKALYAMFGYWLNELKTSKRSRYRRVYNKFAIDNFLARESIIEKVRKELYPLAKPPKYIIIKPEVLTEIEDIIKKNLPDIKCIKTYLHDKEGWAEIQTSVGSIKFGLFLDGKMQKLSLIINEVPVAFPAGMIKPQGNARMYVHMPKYILNYAMQVSEGVLWNDAIESTEPYHWESLPNSLGAGVMAIANIKSKNYMLVNNLIFEVNQQEIEKEDFANKQKQLKSLTDALEGAISKSDKISKDIGNPLSLLVSAVGQNIDRLHYITSPFAKMAIESSYVEYVLGDMPLDISNALTSLRNYYDSEIKKRISVFTSVDPQKSFSYQVDYNGQHFIRVFNQGQNETAFISNAPIVELNSGHDISVFVYSANIYDGQHQQEPEGQEPKRIESWHRTGGILAQFQFDKKSFHSNDTDWNKHIFYLYNRNEKVYGESTWVLPPHIVKLSDKGYVDGIAVKKGYVPSLTLATNLSEEEKFKKKSSWLQLCADKLISSGELHLLFKYFFKYTFDSPIPSNQKIIGNNRERGDFHQTVYQTLERKLGSKLLCDCDDLAEVYADIVNRQGKIAYVLGVPGHATCGWVEQVGEEYAMNFLDTGPPRRLMGKTLNDAIEAGVKSYDSQNMVNFNPTAIHFLFRFAGEPVRQSYYLDARIMTDKAYGKKMVDVQEAWHFSYLMQGIKTMEEVLVNDKMAANYFEISGFNRELGRGKEAIEYYQEGIKQLPNEVSMDKFTTNLNALFQYARYDRAVLPDKLTELLKEFEEIKKKNPQGHALRSIRFRLSNLLMSAKMPTQAYQMIEGDLKNPYYLNLSFISSAISMLNVLKKEHLEKAVPLSPDDSLMVQNLEGAIKQFVDKNLFKKEDDLFGSLMKYQTLFSFYIAKDGWKKALEEMSKKEFPDNLKKSHMNRAKASEAEDWSWIRLNINSHYSVLAYQLKKPEGDDQSDDEESAESKKYVPTQEQWNAAFTVFDRIKEVYGICKKENISKNIDFSMYSMSLMVATKKGDWKQVQEILTQVKKEDWAVLYRAIRSQVGNLSLHVSKEDFIKLFKLFDEIEPPKQHYYAVVYGAYALEKYDHALAAAEITANRFKTDELIQEEYKLLKEDLAKKK